MPLPMILADPLSESFLRAGGDLSLVPPLNAQGHKELDPDLRQRLTR